jgi:RNA polymerase sigma-70 factor (ECF subfamily)
MVTPRDAWTDRSEVLAQALARVAIGDRAAFATLYQTSSAHLFGVILRINPDRSQAEDILQDIFVNIWRAAPDFDATRSQPLTWLTSIARHRAIDSLRRRKTEVSTVSTHAVVAGADGEDEVDLLAAQASPDDGPLALLQQAAQAREVTHCLGQLSAEQQQCVALTYYQGLSHSEVADHLAQPLGTVKSWVRRALLALKDCLGRPASAGQSDQPRQSVKG